MAERFFVVQVRQRGTPDQPVVGHRYNPVQQSQHHVSEFRARRFGIE